MERGCPSCGRMIDEVSKTCPYCNYDFTKLNRLYQRYESENEIKISKYAGFIKRMAANSIDMFLMFVIFTIIEGIYLYFINPSLFENFSLVGLDFNEIIFLVIPYLCLPFVYFFYCVFMQCSKSMGTLGEKFVGIEVVDDLESPLTFGLSFKRNFFRILNVISLEIGNLMIIFTSRKQALNDLAANTFVLNRITNENFGGFSYAHLFVRFLAFVIDLLVLYFIYVLFGYLHEFVAGLDIEFRSTLLNLCQGIMILIMVFYFPYTESTRGASIGKLFFKLRVKKMDGEKPGFFKSIIRLVCLFIEMLILPFGTLLAFVMPRKQTFKDLLTRTIVVNKF